jgi:predicted RNase H-like nuclease (RuvC/YqgF family)
MCDIEKQECHPHMHHGPKMMMHEGCGCRDPRKISQSKEERVEMLEEHLRSLKNEMTELEEELKKLKEE